MSVYTKEQVRNLVDGKLDWDTTLRMLQMPKDKERFEMYRDILQAKMPWKGLLKRPAPFTSCCRPSSRLQGIDAT